MDWTTYLMIALLVLACIPLLDFIATWYYLGLAKGVPVFGVAVPWADPAPRDRDVSITQSAKSVASDGESTRLGPNWARPDLSGAPADMQSKMRDLGIGFDGRQYTFSSYRYDRLSDAINYAELTRARSAPQS